MAANEKADRQKIGRDRTDELLRFVFEELKARGGAGRPKEILAAVAKKAGITPQ